MMVHCLNVLVTEKPHIIPILLMKILKKEQMIKDYDLTGAPQAFTFLNEEEVKGLQGESIIES